jgi:hypothetical protein
LAVIVDFAINSKYHLSVSGFQGLTARLRINDGKPFVRLNRRLANIDARPIGTSVTDFAGLLQRTAAQFFRLALYAKYSNYATHNSKFFFKTPN